MCQIPGFASSYEDRAATVVPLNESSSSTFPVLQGEALYRWNLCWACHLCVCVCALCLRVDERWGETSEFGEVCLTASFFRLPYIRLKFWVHSVYTGQKQCCWNVQEIGWNILEIIWRALINGQSKKAVQFWIHLHLRQQRNPRTQSHSGELSPPKH